MDKNVKGALTAHDLYWESYLNGHTDVLASLLDDDYLQIGSVENEVFFNKHDAVRFVNETIGQIENRVQMRNRITKTWRLSDYILIIEFCDLYVLINETWNFYAKFRASSLLQQKTDGWKLIHQHSSVPDLKAQEGENIAIDKITKENLELKNAIKRRTIELEHKNRDLEIEASLERVRTRMMAMQESGDIREVASVMYTELRKLGFQYGACTIIIMAPNSRDMEWWIGGFEEGEFSQAYQITFFEHPIYIEIWNGWKHEEDFKVIPVTGKYKESFDEELFLRNGFKDVPESVKAWMLAQPSAIFSLAYMKHGALHWGPDPLSAEQGTILQRFAKTFEQTYTRFLDLQKAEDQAREAQIEAALERVRSKAMSIQISEDLRTVVEILYEQLKNLGFQWGVASIVIMDPDTGDMDWWMEGFGDGYVLPERYHVPFFEHSGHLRQLEHWKSGIPYAEIEISGQEKKAYDAYYFYQTDFSKAPETSKQLMMQHDSVLFSMAFMEYGALSWSPTSLIKEQATILERFAKVFEQCYTRFLDLQKAEAQARESQIEAALERVRSRTMGMHRSDELEDAATLLFQQIRDLGIKTWTTGFNVWLDGDNAYQDWLTTPEGGFIEPYIVDLTQYSVFKKIREAKLRGDEFYVGFEDEDTIKETYKHLMKYAPDQFGKLLEDGFQFPSQQYDHFVFGKKVSLLFITYEPVPEAHDIFKRFGKVFEQTYTRFLDLQKAEAQAREAKIEAALERVRSTSMAMHHSDELEKVVSVLSEQMAVLGITFEGALIFIFDSDKRHITLWIATNHLPAPLKVNLPHEAGMMDNPILKDLWDAFDKGESNLNKTYTGKVKDDYFRYVGRHNDETIPQAVRQLQIELPTWTMSYVAEKNSVLAIDSWSEKIISNEEFNILKRFAVVFEQAYTRFLDLQNAEAQAREAQIEAALEKIRSKSLSMHKSDDLKEVVAILFEKLKELGLVFDGGAGVKTYKESLNDAVLWIAAPDHVSSPSIISIPFEEKIFLNNPMLYDIWKAREAGTDIFNRSYSLKEKNEYFNFLFLNNDYNQIPQSVRDWILQTPNYTGSEVFNHHTSVIINSYSGEIITEKQFEILKRIGKVFEQAYIRFLDLQKAEEQAREAKIEAALERVRSSAMAMQNSRDLNTLIGKVFTECTKLDIQLDRGIIMIYDPETLDARKWMANPEAPDNPRDFFVQHHNHTPNLAYLEAWKNKVKKWTYVLEGEEKAEWDAFLFVETELTLLPAEVKQIMMGFKKVYLNSSFNNFGCLTLATIEPMSDSDFDILLRFARVFDLTYTRFNDLKQAEAQAREAQIETALERIRAKALAMHQSDELMEVALTLREQMGLLGQKEMEASVIHFYNLKKETIQSWHVLNTPGSEKGDVSAGSFEIRKDTCQLTQQFFTEFQSEKNEYSIVAEREVLWDWLEYLTSISPDVKESLKDLKPDKVFFHFSKFSDGALLMVSTSPPTEESKYLQKRAAQVFELAYKRFLDLKQTEKLARKAELDLIRLMAEKVKTEEALKELEATQAQLVQQEKLASLGQLTAGIAHEIKNPLNFVNNFSEVSLEMIEEAREEVRRVTEGNPLLPRRDPDGKRDGIAEGDARGVSGDAQDSTLILEILNDIENNLRKIHEHGSRADGIVKSMLQHSRGGTGKIQPTDLNALVKEYVNLAYHGMRAGKDPISVDIDLQLDKSVGEIPLIAENFSRVILNLCNNGFDAMREKVTGDGGPKTGKSYTPILTVRTHQKDNIVTIEIEDNGPGIPEEIKDKILQPFFTTKKGTQGTGLGLSITNDIVKAHGGVMQIKSDKHGSIFSIIINL